jgi:hypothetical protein
MKTAFAIVFLAFACLNAFAQDNTIERDFERSKARYKLEKFAEGEDATSGYDYFVYKDKGQVVKMREIWSSSQADTYRAEDYYYSGGKLIALVKYTFNRKYYKTAEKGANIPLKLVEKMYLTDAKLATWIENGKTVPKDDKRWLDKEKEVLEAGKSMLENYSWLKKGS